MQTIEAVVPGPLWWLNAPFTKCDCQFEKLHAWHCHLLATKAHFLLEKPLPTLSLTLCHSQFISMTISSSDIAYTHIIGRGQPNFHRCQPKN